MRRQAMKDRDITRIQYQWSTPRRINEVIRQHVGGTIT